MPSVVKDLVLFWKGVAEHRERMTRLRRELDYLVRTKWCKCFVCQQHVLVRRNRRPPFDSAVLTRVLFSSGTSHWDWMPSVVKELVLFWKGVAEHRKRMQRLRRDLSDHFEARFDAMLAWLERRC